jgi:hypothetical protein
MRIEAEGASPAHKDHMFTPPDGRPWGLCVICHLSEPAHTLTSDPMREWQTATPTAEDFVGTRAGGGERPDELPNEALCERCGGMMRRTGNCFTCPNCGHDTGCG